MKFNKFLFVFVALFCCCNIEGSEYYFKNIDIGQRLSQSSITAILYDSHGSLWIGTKYGLNEYRNQSVKRFVGKDRAMLKGDNIQMIYEDSSRKLWVSTEKGLFIYNRESNSFKFMDSHPTNGAIEFDDKLFFGCYSGYMVYENDSLRRVSLQLGSIKEGHIYNDSLFLVSHNDGIYKLNGNLIQKVSIPSIDGKLIMASTLVGNRLFLSIYNEGFYSVNLNTYEIKQFNSSNSGLSFDVVLCLALSDNNLWIGTDGGGICIMDLQTDRISNIEFHSNSVTTLFPDTFGNIWAGTVREGVWGIRKTNIQSLTMDDGGLSNNVINSIWDDGKYIWIGTDGGGLDKFDPSTGKVTSIKSTAGMKISSITDLDENHLLISVYTMGFKIVDKRSGNIQPFILVDKSTDKHECYHANAPRVYNIDDKILIMAINTYEYNPNSRSFYRLTFEGGNQTYEMKICNSNASSDIYTFSSSGVFRVDLTKRHLNRLPITLESETGIINSVAVAGDTVWIGSQHGLFLYNLSDNTTLRFKTNLFERVTTLKPDTYGNLWIASDNSMFLMKDGLLQYFGEDEGFSPNEILTSTPGYISSDNSVYFGGTKGLVRILEPDIKRGENEKQIKLGKIETPVKHFTLEGDRLTLPNRFEGINIYVQISNADPFERIMYRYEMSGSESYSVETFSDYLSVQTLKDGNYTLSVSTFGKDGQWNEPVAILHIKVKKPWYRNTYFILFWIFALALILYFSFNSLYKKKIAEMQAQINKENSDFLMKFNTIILNRLSDPDLDVPILAKEMAMSRASLYSRVKSATGMAVRQYIDSIRMEEAAKLLSDKALSIAEVSEKTGYASQRYFSTRFKQSTGMSPRDYRKSKSENRSTNAE